MVKPWGIEQRKIQNPFVGDGMANEHDNENIKNEMKTNFLYIIMLILLALPVSATVPLPDMVLFGKLFDVNGQQMTVANNGTVLVEVQVNDAVGSDDPIIANTELQTSDVANAGDIYILRIPREDGNSPTAPDTAIMGDMLHITINGVEVTETSNNNISVTGDLEDVRNIDLHLSSVLPPLVREFTVMDPTETSPGFTNQREISVSIDAMDSDGTITGWIINETNIPVDALDAAWLVNAPMTYTLPDLDGSYDLFAWVRDSSNLVSNLNINSATRIILDRQMPTVSIADPLEPLTTNESIASVQGNAMDGNELHSIEARVNRGDWNLIGVVSPWTLNTPLELGANTIDFRAIDAAGNISDIQTGPIITLEELPPGSVQVTIFPQEAVDSGAQWRLVRPGFDSGFRDSDFELIDLEIGEYTLIFQTLLDWETPADQPISVMSGQKVRMEGIYIEITDPTELFRLSMKPGWNFFSVPIDPINKTLSNVFRGERLGGVWYWDGMFMQKTAVIVPGRGYWVYWNRAETEITIQGEDISGTVVPLSPNWNSVGPILGPGVNSEYDPVSIPPSPQMFDNIDSISLPIWYWDNTRFRVARQLVPGVGYLIFINEQ